MCSKIGRLTVLHFFLLATLLRADPETISLDSIEFPKDFSIVSSHYTMDPQAQKSDEPGFLKFKVTSTSDAYEVESLAALGKLLHEIEVIEQIRSGQKGDSNFLDGVNASVEQTSEGFENLVSHPAESVKGVGKAVGKLGKGITGIFRKKEAGEKSSFSEKMLGSSERELAKEWNVDVYSDNPHLEQLLKRMARSRLSGKGAVSIGTFFLGHDI